MVYIEVEGKRYGPCTHDEAISYLRSQGWSAQLVPDHPTYVYFCIADLSADGPAKARFAQIIEIEEAMLLPLNMLPRPQRRNTVA